MKTSTEIFTVFRIEDNIIEFFDTFTTYAAAARHFTKRAKGYYPLSDETIEKYLKKRILIDKKGNSIQLISQTVKL